LLYFCCREFAEGVDVLTVEIEHIDADALEAVHRDLGLDVEPTPAMLRLIQARHMDVVTHKLCQVTGEFL